MIEIPCNNTPPTTGGMYLFCEANTTDMDGHKALTPVWVFDYHGSLLFMPLSESNRGKPLAEYPRLAAHSWSERVVPASSRQRMDSIPPEIIDGNFAPRGKR